VSPDEIPRQWESEIRTQKKLQRLGGLDFADRSVQTRRNPRRIGLRTANEEKFSHQKMIPTREDFPLGRRDVAAVDFLDRDQS